MSKLLITGGTGSFGSTVARRFLNDDRFSEVIIFSRDEKKQHDMRQEFKNSKLRFVIGDVRDERSVGRVCYGVDYIFHAAALKQVPTGEFAPLEAVKTNILGSYNVLHSAADCGVKKVVLLSTDKAVYPINAMGMTKAVAEKILIAESGKSHHNSIFCSVRYGNVMASRGSVIPLFVDQVKAGKNITITEPTMTRFLLSLDHAVDLVDFAFEEGRSGDLFIKKAPACTVEVLAKAILEIFEADNEIEIVGIRKGEKIHETLANQIELISAEDMGDYYRINHNVDENYDKFFTEGDKVSIPGDYTSDNTKQLSIEETKGLLLTLDYIQDELKKWSKKG